MMVTTILFFIVITFQGTFCKDRIRLEEVKTLTLYEGRYTNGRRSSPVPQLKCVGGSAGCSAFVPKVVQCENKGSDGYDVQWECKTDMSNRYRFGRIQVNCEGYDSPNDPYVLRGSCGLEYTIDKTEGGRNRKKSSGGSHYGSKKRSSDSLGNVTFMVVIALAIFFIYYTCIKPRAPTPDYGMDTGVPDGSPPPYPGPPGPPPPGFRPEYTQNDGDSCGTRFRATPTAPSTDNTSGSSGGGGFWTGAALGGLTGYLFGSSGSANTYSSRSYYTDSGDRIYPDIRRSRDSSSSGSDSSGGHGTRTASGFGGTSRR